MKKLSTLALGLAIASTMSYAGSFQLPTQGVRQSAMGGSGTAYPWDASAIFFNPANLSRMKNFEVTAQMYFLNPQVRYAALGNSTYFTDNERKLSTPFNFYAGGKLHKDDKIGFGLGVYTPYGSSVNWGTTWMGKYINQDISLQSIYFQPTISYEINDVVSIGAGVVYAHGNMEINKALPVQGGDGDGSVNLKGNGNGWGVNAGINVKPTDYLNLGLTFRSGVNMKVDGGTATFNVPSSLASNFPNTDFKTALQLPHMVTFGIAANLSRNVIVQGDFIFSNWASYKKLNFDFEQNTDQLQDSEELRKFRNTFAVRLGIAWTVTKGLDLMAGYSYDPTPTNDLYMSPDAVDGNRRGFSVGVSYSPVEQFNISASASYLSAAERTAYYQPANFGGAYQIKSFSPSVGISYRFIK